jgi:PAS domain S-box-containing protein
MGNEDDRLTRSLRAVSRAAEALTSPLDLAAALEVAIQALVSGFDSALARIWIHDENAGVLELRASAGLSMRTQDSSRARIDIATYPNKIGEVARTRRAFVKNGLRGEPGFDPLWVEREGLEAVAVCPLAAGADLLGVLVHYARRPFTDEEIEAVRTLASLVAIVVARRRFEAEVAGTGPRAVARARAVAAPLTPEERLREVVSNAPIVLFALDAQGIFTLSEGRGLEPMGLKPGEVVGRSAFELYGNASSAVDAVKRCLAGETVVSYVELGGAAYEAHYEPLRDSLGKVTGLIGVATDVTERKRVLEKLRNQQSQSQLIFDAVPAMIWFKDGANRILRCNKAAAATIGRTVEQVEGRRTEELYPDEAAAYLADDLEVIRSDRPKLGIVELHQTGTGDKIWVSTDKIPYHDVDGNVSGVLVFATEITQLKRAEEALRAEKERLDVTLRSIGDGVIATDTNGSVVLINEVAERLTGWRQADALGKPLQEVFQVSNERSGERGLNPVERVLRTGGIVALANHTVLESRTGGKSSIADSGAPIRNEAGTIVGVVLVFRDVTETQRLEGELLKAAKIESIGLLAAGIAHDFNNILTAVTANVSLVMRSLERESEAHALLSEVDAACRQAAELTRQLLTFGAGGAPVRETVSIGTLLGESAGFALRGSNVKHELALAPDLWPVDVDPTQISQVIHNLVINAQQAMPRGGVVTIRGANATIAANERALPLAPGRYVKVAIVDHGCGIERANLAKVFDPFYTTKPKGTGLGLTTTYSILKRHDGHVTCESEPGVGTTFTLYLRASDRPVKVRPDAHQGSLSGRGRILVMDDQDRIRDVAGRILRYLGYEPAFARDGVEAVALYAEALRSGKPFAAVILDLTVPGGMGGTDAIERLRAIDPGVRAIASSGYSMDPTMAEFREHGFAGRMAKPYGVDELGQMLREVLGPTGPS